MSGKSGEYVPSPRPNPRLRPEGAAYAERNRGTMERWFDYSDAYGNAQTTTTTTTTPAAAATGTEGEEDAGSVPQDQGQDEGQSDSQPSTPTDHTPGLQGEGEGPAITKVTDQYRQLSVGSSRTPAEEAREYAERNRGQMDHVINNYRAAPSPPPNNTQDVPATQTQVTDTGRSPSTSPSHEPPQSPRDSARQRTLHQESQGRAWDETRPAPRIRPDGESIAQKHSTDSMFDIMRSDGSPQASPAKTAGRASHHSQESGPPAQAAVQPRARPGEGMRNYERAHNQSEMAAIMRGEGDAGCRRQQRNSRHLQRSELW